MIEMRWKNLKTREQPPAYAIPIEGQIVTGYRVLQFREAPTGEHFADPPDYDWKDVKFAD